MQNSCMFGEVAKQPYRISIPRKEPIDPEPPAIRSRITQKFTDRDMEFYQTEEPTDYKIFIEKKLRKKDKRVTCIARGSVEYGTAKSK